MSPDLPTALLGSAKLPLAAFGLGFARILGLMQILPVSNRLGLGGMHRAAVAAALALPLLPLIASQLGAEPPAGGRMLLLTAKEAGLGFGLGVIFAAPFWAAETAGELIDLQRGSRGAVTPDAAQKEEGGITATLFVLTVITLFILSGGMHWIFQTVAESFRLWPAGSLAPRLAADAPQRLLALLDGVLGGGLILAAPLLIAMFFAEFGLALVSRFAPQLNVFDLSMSVKGLVQVIGLPVYAGFLLGYFREGLTPLAGLAERLSVWTGG